MKNFAIVDIETNGRANRITEIAVIIYDGEKVIDTFSSLVNPGGSIPPFITALTGIHHQMLSDAPTFQEIADKINSITQNCIFVAHNVNFDYNIIKYEFENIGLKFHRQKLCSVRLARKVIPGHHSYSLGNICSALGIGIKNRHRAMGDAQATLALIQKLQQKENYQKSLEMLLHNHSRAATIPSKLDKTEFDNLPSQPGIYYFLNEQKQIIYVGKAKNIQKRVLSHFYSKSKYKISMLREIAHVDFELSGTELIALLMEDAAIKKHFPKYNKASKQRITGFGLTTYKDRKGVQHLGLQPIKQVKTALKVFYNLIEARLFMEDLVQEFELCAKYCHLLENANSCEKSIYKGCLGVCSGKEAVDDYNRRVEAAIFHIQNALPDGWIKQKGRTVAEDAFIRIKQGKYCGYGFVDKHLEIRLEELDDFMISEKDNMQVRQILYKEMSKLVTI